MAVTGEKLIYEIQVNSSGASEEFKKLDKSVNQLNKSTQNISKTFDLFKGVLAGYLSFQGAKAFIELADAMQETQLRLAALTGDMETAVLVQEELFNVAQKHSVAIKDLSNSYIKLAPALSEQGKSQAEIIQFTDNLIASYKLIGQSSTEAAQSVGQLADAYASGKIDAGQLGTVLLSNRELLKAVAKELGVTERELKKMAKTGKVSGEEMFQAVLKAGEEWQKKAAELPTGINEAITNLTNNFSKLAIEFIPVVEIISKGIITISKNFAGAAAAVAGLTAALVIAKLSTLELNAAMLLNPVTALAALFAAAAYLIHKNWDGIALFFKELLSVTLPNAVDEFTIFWIKFVNVISNFFAEGMNKIIEVYNETIGKISGTKIEPFELDFNIEEIELINQAIEKRERVFAKYVLTLDDATKSTEELKKAEDKLGKKPPREEPTPPPKTFGEDLTEEDWAWLDENRVGSVGEAMDMAIEKTETLNDALKDLGTNDPWGGFSVGLQQAMAEVPTITESFAQIGKDVFQGLTDNMLSFIDTGKFEFGEFFKDLGKSIAKIGIQKLAIYAIDLAMKAIGITPVAKGGVFENGKLTPFARGGIVDKPTLFPMANGMGLMGEAGPEAVMPLSRNQQGRLGVDAKGMGGSTTIVNVFNQTKDSEVETKETEDTNGMKKIDIFIKSKIKSAFQSGEMDKTMQNNFGLSRSGSR